ncbi:hypothetical protein CC1G_13259 [Coprinopsis cinerea okayama7|uniref:F-box domain-containing protein n=1 Tax=Coprinopsis cinerea (strain Okayama-7 / 130 / ATCC MYA-4618 / FGSC 9003) TaxID=240176 RepID=A8PI72_COPC7|nr:hypothetical protein CC1G_13259 [Coprinopsis cinerea okayama7\|eukprot:XP_001841527.2 hypothetical protein CC1G_13259 [Coprinopsis cinerea okayama7\
MARRQTSPLLNLPSNILVRILVTVNDAHTVLVFSRTCQKAHSIVFSGNSSEFLWKEYHRQRFNDPNKTAQERRFYGLLCRGEDLNPPQSCRTNWRQRFMSKMKALKTIDDFHNTASLIRTTTQALEEIALMLMNLPVFRAPDLDLDFTLVGRALSDYPFSHPTCEVPRDSALLRNNLEYQTLYDRYQNHYARLLCLTSKQLEQYRAIRSRGRIVPQEWDDVRTEARCFVYNSPNYSPATFWGPIFVDRTADWLDIKYIMTIVWMAALEVPQFVIETPYLPPVGLSGIRPRSAPGPYNPADWAGVEGRNHRWR